MKEPMKSVDCVKEFHQTFEHPIATINSKEPLNIRQLRVKLLFEEVLELAEASDVVRTFQELCLDFFASVDTKYGHGEPKDGDNVNRVEELDALCDIQYVLDGKKLTSGLHEVFDKAFQIVHQNNMTKAHRSPEHVQETAAMLRAPLECVERNGVFIAVNSDGKTTKPHDHKKVSLIHLIPA